MTILRPLIGFRLTEILVAVLIMTVLTAWSLSSYSAYVINARLLDEYYELNAVRMSISIDSAFTGLPNGDGKNLLDLDFLSNAQVSEQGHIFGEIISSRKNAIYASSLVGKTIALHRNVNSQSGYVFVTWRCPDNGLVYPYKVMQPAPEATLNPKFSYFYCNGGLL